MPPPPPPPGFKGVHKAKASRAKTPRYPGYQAHTGMEQVERAEDVGEVRRIPSNLNMDSVEQHEEKDTENDWRARSDSHREAHEHEHGYHQAENDGHQQQQNNFRQQPHSPTSASHGFIPPTRPSSRSVFKREHAQEVKQRACFLHTHKTACIRASYNTSLRKVI